MITIILIVGLVLSAIHFKRMENRTQSSSDKIENQTEERKENQEEIKKEDNLPNKTEAPNINNPLKEGQTPPSETTKENEISETSSPTTIEKEEGVVAHFEALELSLANSEDENIPSVRERAKNVFTETVDFLFYGSTINGYTFESLTTKTKLKIIEIALKIDNKIDAHFPNYKDNLKEKMANLKGSAALLYLETTANMCKSIGESACEEARNNFRNMKNSFGFTWNIIKEAATNASTSLKTILSEWYQSIK